MANNTTWLDGLDPVRLVEDEKVKNQFISIYSKIHRVSLEEAESFYSKESLYYKKSMADEKKELTKCTKLSLYNSFISIADTGLSIQPRKYGTAYLEKRNTNIGTRDNPVWRNDCNLVTTAYGDRDMAIKAGKIIAMTNPIVVYEGDLFQPRTNQKGELYVEYIPIIPRKATTIIACWVRIVLPGGINDFKWLDQGAIQRLKMYSVPKGKGKTEKDANALYTSNDGQIDTGFLETKTIKHSLKAVGSESTNPFVVHEDDPDDLEDAAKPRESFAAPEPEAKGVIIDDPDQSF